MLFLSPVCIYYKVGTKSDRRAEGEQDWERSTSRDSSLGNSSTVAACWRVAHKAMTPTPWCGLDSRLLPNNIMPSIERSLTCELLDYQD